MPYLDILTRACLDDGEPPTAAGELNYCLTRACVAYTETWGVNYETLNTIIGALESAKLEFYRRLVAVYEDQKIEDNGDVYE